jgi:hypothetical protein
LDSLSKSDSELALLLVALPDGSLGPHNFNRDKLQICLTGYKKFDDSLIPIFRSLKVE